MRCHVQKTVVNCFAVLRQLRSIRPVPTSVYHTLIVALVLSRLDYGNAVLVGLPAYLYNRLQSVLNAAARSITGLRRSDHITDTLASFHWLRALERIQLKLATIVYRSLNGTAPRYLASDLRRLSDMPSRRRLRSSLTDQLDIRQSLCSTTNRLLWLVLDYGTVCHEILSCASATHCLGCKCLAQNVQQTFRTKRLLNVLLTDVLNQ